ncbi:MAG: hypothetical protein HQ504_02275 [Rhodospirillaceae bacterium]|nr:hypothetical protein [Rhodospirillaceae bacterium]
MRHKIAMAAAMVFALGAAAAGAAEFTIKDDLTLTECGDCHMAFAPIRLTSGGWKKIMNNLGDHFGEDASLSAKTTKHIEAYLVSKSLDAKETVPGKMKIKQWAKKGLVDPIRITETPYWTRAHNSAKYKRMSKAVGYSRGSNCIKCHKNAETGTFEEFPGLYETD